MGAPEIETSGSQNFNIILSRESYLRILGDSEEQITLVITVLGDADDIFTLISLVHPKGFLSCNRSIPTPLFLTLNKPLLPDERGVFACIHQSPVRHEHEFAAKKVRIY